MANGTLMEIDGKIFDVDPNYLNDGGWVPGYPSGGGDIIKGGPTRSYGLAKIPLNPEAGGGYALFYNGEYIGNE